MKVSVVIPCHNSSNFLDAALDSVADQELPAHEVIVVDDRSTDDSAEIARRHRVNPIVLSVDYGNAAPTRNAGIEQATGDWVAFLDADNIWFPEHLSNARDLLETSDDVLFTAPPVVETPEIPERIGHARADHPLDQQGTGLKEIDFVRWRLNLWGYPTTGTIARLDRVRAVGGFDVTQQRRHDFELVMRIIAGHSWCATPVSSWWSRPIREGNISADKPVCAYYAHRALHLNRERFESDDFHRLIRKAALNATKNAVYARNPDLKRKAMALASQDMGFKEKLKLAIFTMVPPPLRSKLINY